MDTLQYLTWSPYFAGIGQEPPVSRARFFERLEKLPPSISEFLLAEGTVTSLQTIAANQRLTSDQLMVTAYLVRRLVVGELFIQEFPASLADRCKIPLEQARAIASSIINETLTPVKDTVRAIQQRAFESKTGSPDQAVLPATPAPDQGNTLNLRDTGRKN